MGSLHCQCRKAPVTLRLLVTIATWAILSHAAASTVHETLPNKIVAAADYRPGIKTKPAVLLLHGFMTTNQLNLIQAMAETVSASGNAVLAPTLSLRIDNRQGGLPCDAIHTHTMEDDLAEIDFWVNWLHEQGYQRIILIGHSTGALQAMVYLAGTPHPAVTQTLAASLLFFGQTPDALAQEQIQAATQRLDAGDAALAKYSLSYCHGNFLAPAAVYLSYAKYDRQAVLDLLNRLPQVTKIILAGNDHRLDEQWTYALRRTRHHVSVIPDAGHFFDGVQEFDFLDAVQQFVESTLDDPAT